MKIFGTTIEFNITREKIKAAFSVVGVMALCSVSMIAVVSTLNAQAAAAGIIQNENDEEVARLLAEAENATTSSEETNISFADESEMAVLETEETTTETSETTTLPSTEPADTSVTDESTTTSASGATSSSATTTPATTTTAATTRSTTTASTPPPTTTTTAAPTTTIGEEATYLVVYATNTINVRSGPGTGYSVVKSLNRGERIDVIAITSNGWYKTAKGNYVIQKYTTTIPIATNTPTPAPTSAPASTTRAATTTTKVYTEDRTLLGTFTIYFYGPVPRGDGTYSTTTASGTTCTEGRTVATDWKVIPKNTTIYIENDPLGGDGIYRAEDNGVSGKVVDIFTYNIPSYGTCKRNVYKVN